MIRLYHFTNEASAKALFEGSVPRLPFHMTVDLELGPNYGSHGVYFELDTDAVEDLPYQVSFVGYNGNGTTNKKTKGMIEMVIKTPKQLRDFFLCLENDGYVNVANLNKHKEEQKLREESIKQQYKANKRHKLAV